MQQNQIWSGVDNGSGVDTSDFADKTDLANLKYNVDKLDSKL